MSLADRMKKKSSEFKPIDLTEENVHAIFRRCSPKAGCQELSPSFLFVTANINPVGNIYHFDKKTLRENSPFVEYLLGQLKAVHDMHLPVAFVSLAEKYDGTIWTKDINTLAELANLGIASGFCSPFLDSEKTTDFILPHTSLSPQDPKFSSWYASGEWIRNSIGIMKNKTAPSVEER